MAVAGGRGRLGCSFLGAVDGGENHAAGHCLCHLVGHGHCSGVNCRGIFLSTKSGLASRAGDGINYCWRVGD